MAVVLPRGRLNNPSEQHLRDFIGERARILAVVSIHPLTFKPHTDTKTCVLFVQKWNDDKSAGPLCKRIDDYPIFFATQLQASKDTSGNKLYVEDKNGERIRDAHGHWVVRHDLFNHEGLTQDGIAEEFSAFAEREGLEFGMAPRNHAAHPSVASEMWSRTVEVARIDADYFQPHFQKLMAALGQKGLRIGDVSRLRREQFAPSLDGDFRYIEIGGISGDGFANDELVSNKDAPSRAKWIVRKGDVITSLVRPSRRITAIIDDDQDGCICSSGFAVLEPISIDREVLFAYLRQPEVCWMMDMHCTASLYPAISATDLMNLPFLPPDKKIEKEVVKNIRVALDQKRQATRLIEEMSEIYGILPQD